MIKIDSAVLEDIANCSSILSVFYLSDPKFDAVKAQAAFDIVRACDVDELAASWPFVDVDAAARVFLEMQTSLNEDSSEDILWEYRRLFVGPEAKAAPPWGSVYTDKESVIFGEATLEFRQWAREVGVEINNDPGEPEDHVGIMLALLAWIAQNRPELLEEYLQQHLLTWAPHFAEIVAREGKLGLFKGLGELTYLTLVGMQDSLELKVDVPKFYR